jgi:hypothetical protein
LYKKTKKCNRIFAQKKGLFGVTSSFFVGRRGAWFRFILCRSRLLRGKGSPVEFGPASLVKQVCFGEMLCVVLGSAGDDAQIQEAWAASEFEWARVPYHPRSNDYVLDEAARELLGRASILVPGGGETVDDALLSLCPNVAVVAANAVGYQGIDLDACARRGVWASNTPVFELRDATADSAMSGPLPVPLRREGLPWLSLVLRGRSRHGAAVSRAGAAAGCCCWL